MLPKYLIRNILHSEKKKKALVSGKWCRPPVWVCWIQESLPPGHACSRELDGGNRLLIISLYSERMDLNKLLSSELGLVEPGGNFN